MSTSIIVAALLLLIAAVSITVAIYWHLSTLGTWKQWPAGRSVMALLIIIGVSHGWGGTNRVLGDYALKQPILAGLYCVFAVALVMIGVTIHKEMATGKKLVAKKDPAAPQTGIITIAVATKPEEKPHDQP